MSREVIRLQAAQDLKIRVRQLRFYSFLNLIDPKHARQGPVDTADKNFMDALDQMQRVARTRADEKHIQTIRDGYRKYKTELAAMPADLKRLGKDPDYHEFAD